VIKEEVTVNPYIAFFSGDIFVAFKFCILRTCKIHDTAGDSNHTHNICASNVRVYLLDRENRENKGRAKI